MLFFIKILRWGIFFWLFLSYFSMAKVKERTLEIQSVKNNFKEITDLAEKEILNILVSELLGFEKDSTELSNVTQKISPKSKKFILLTKVIQTQEMSESQKKEKKDDDLTTNQKKDSSITPDFQFVSEVLVRFSLETLQSVLIEENLFYKDKGFNRALAFIELKDKVNRETYRWWEKKQTLSSDAPLVKATSQFYRQVQSIFMKHGFYSIHPIFSRYHQMIPENMDYQSLNKRTAKALAQFFNAHLMIVGSITVDQSTLSDMYEVVWDLSLYHTTHLRRLEVHKFKTKIKNADWKFLIEPHYLYWAKNFAMELNSIYHTGTLSAQLFTIEIEGSLTFFERKSIKENLIEKIKYIKNLTESVINKHTVQYSADVEGEDHQVVEAIQNLKVLDLKLSPSVQSDKHILIQVKKS